MAPSDETSLDVMLKSMRLLLALADESSNDEKQFEHYIRAAAAVAKDVAPYIHLRISTVEQVASTSPVKTHSRGHRWIAGDVIFN